MAEVGSDNGNQPLTYETAEEMLEGTAIHPREFRHVDMARWDDDVAAPDENIDSITATTYIANRIVNYLTSGSYDDTQFWEFREDFEGWTERMLRNANTVYTRELKRVLRHKGVWTGPNNIGAPRALASLLEQVDWVEWPRNQLPAGTFHNSSLAYRDQQRITTLQPRTVSSPRQPHATLQRQQESQMADITSPSLHQNQEEQADRDQRGQPETSQSEQAERSLRNPGLVDSIEGAAPQRNVNQKGTTPAFPQFPQLPQLPRQSVPPLPETTSNNPYSAIPPLWYRNEEINPTMITTFTKLWDKDKKYSGKPYDLLDNKLKLFYSICRHVGIHPGQFHAVFPRILTDRAEDYYITFLDEQEDPFVDVYRKMKAHFDTDVNHSHYYTDWTTISFIKYQRENPDKTLFEVLEMMLDKLQLCQKALGFQYQGEYALRTAVIAACRGVKELEMALFKPPIHCEELFGDLRSSIENSLTSQVSTALLADAKKSDQFYLDRRYNSSSKGRGDSLSRGQDNTRSLTIRNTRSKQVGFADKKCFVCQKTGCWSTNHTLEERRKAKMQYFAFCEFNGDTPDFSPAYLADYEGEPDSFSINSSSSTEDEASTAHFLQSAAFLHRITGEDDHSNEVPQSGSDTFMIEDRYARNVYQGILPDSGAADKSTVGKAQFLALQSKDPSITMDTSTAGDAQIKFGQGNTIASIGTTSVKTPIGTIDFHVLEAATPFLLCLADMDKLSVYYNNITDEMIQGETRLPVVRKWGHPWFHLGKAESARVFLTETELRRLHRRFGHPATDRLYKMLKRAGHKDVEEQALKEVRKFCHQCQKHSSSPQRFKFTLKDDREFNYEVLVDVMYLSGKPVLHVVDSATSFQAGRFLPSMSTKDTWEALRMLWIDTYQGPPDILTHDAGTNFASTEFRTEATIMGITCKQIPVEAHWSIGKLERYHAPLRRAYEIITAELRDSVSSEARLQMALKAVNDTVGPDGLVPTLLVFGAYPRVVMDSPPSPSMIHRSQAIQKATKELRKMAAERQVRDALNTRNGPSVEDVLALPLQSEVLVWREKDGWQGPYKVISTQGHDVTVDMVNGPTTFRSTIVKPYLRDDQQDNHPAPQTVEADRLAGRYIDIPDPLHIHPAGISGPRKRGRPPGSKNKKMSAAQYLSKKEEDDLALAAKLRLDGIITTPGDPFEESDAKEINDLVGRGVFSFELFNQHNHGRHRIFKSRMVREIKAKSTKPYEKSRLVIQGYNDQGKEAILTQSPTIQRASQRLITAIAPALLATEMSLELRDITQAYPQAQTNLFRTILAHLPYELQTKYPEGTIIRVIKPLYGIPEAGVHWFATYHGHHIRELNMVTSTYDPCLLITAGEPERFGIIGMQTDDTLMLGTTEFSQAEEEARDKAQFRAKPKTRLKEGTPLEFNGCTLTMNGETIGLTQKGQGSRIIAIDMTAPDRAQRYMEQRARGAYIASICQPEASFTLSVAAQAQKPNEEDFKKLNCRLQWQADNLDRGLNYVPIDLSRAKLMIFTDGSFANNRDLSSQLGFMVTLVNESQKGDHTFLIRGNMIHWSSTKCKRVTRSVLASELYGMVNGFDIGIAIATTLKLVTDRLKIQTIPVIVCTDSYSLYECLVKLGTTSEKRLMIDVMALRQSYERREITEIRCISGEDNPADAFTKESPNKALQTFIDNNELSIRVESSVQRPAR